MRLLLFFAFALTTLVGRAQTTPLPVPSQAISQLEDLKELTKKVVANNKPGGRRPPAEASPEMNRFLVIAADDFVRVTRDKPTQEAYLTAIDKGLDRVSALATTKVLRQQVADYYLELMEIVGLTTSAGKLDAFVSQAPDGGRR